MCIVDTNLHYKQHIYPKIKPTSGFFHVLCTTFNYTISCVLYLSLEKSLLIPE